MVGRGCRRGRKHWRLLELHHAVSHAGEVQLAGRLLSYVASRHCCGLNIVLATKGMCLIRLMSNSLDKLSQIHDLVIEQVLEDLQNGDRKAHQKRWRC